jgi:hypothetical protein
MDGIGEKDETSTKAEVPEGYRNNALPLFFGCDPLDEKSHGEHRLTNEPHNDPEVNLEILMLTGER